jgi:hypothetical protein
LFVACEWTQEEEGEELSRHLTLLLLVAAKGIIADFLHSLHHLFQSFKGEFLERFLKTGMGFL